MQSEQAIARSVYTRVEPICVEYFDAYTVIGAVPGKEFSIILNIWGDEESRRRVEDQVIFAAEEIIQRRKNAERGSG